MVGVLFLGVIQTGLIMLDFETYVDEPRPGRHPHRRGPHQPIGRAVGRVMTELDSIRKVEVRGLVKTYPGVIALDGADVTIPGGSILGLLGKNGAGKSHAHPVPRRRRAAGRGRGPRRRRADLDRQPARRDGARLRLRAPGAGGRPEPLGRRERRCSASATRSAAAAWSGAERRAHARARCSTAWRRRSRPRAPLSSLSVAERRLVMIARGLAANARMFVLDEPTASLTEDEIDHLHKVLAQPAQGGRGDRLRQPPARGDLRHHRPGDRHARRPDGARGRHRERRPGAAHRGDHRERAAASRRGPGTWRRPTRASCCASRG